MVCSKLEFVAIFCETCRGIGYTSVVHQDVETGGGQEKGICGGFDGSEGREVKFKVIDIGTRDCSLDFVESKVIFLSSACCEVDLGFFGC